VKKKAAKKAKKARFTKIKVTMELTYLVEMIDQTHTEINGWTVEQVVDDWFQRHDVNRSHATRDGYLLGGSGKKVLKIETEELA